MGDYLFLPEAPRQHRIMIIGHVPVWVNNGAGMELFVSM